MSDEEAIAEANAKNPRFTHWCANLVFSVITMWSAIVVKEADNSKYGHKWNTGRSAPYLYEQWAMVTTAVTLSLSGLVVLLYIVPPTRRFIEGKALERILILLMVGWWCAAVAVITDTKHGVAVDNSNTNSAGSVTNGNLYYFSWAGFVSSITLFVSYMRTAYGVDIEGEIQSRAARLNLWSAMIATSAIVCGSSVVVFLRTCKSLSHAANSGRPAFADGQYCMRTIYGISVGGSGLLLAILVVALKLCLSKMPLIVETIFSYALLPAWCVGVAFITSKKGPGSGLGNLYYFTWLSFIISFMLAASATDDRKRKDLASDVV